MSTWQDSTLYERILQRWEHLESKYSTLKRNREIIIRYFRSDENITVDDSRNDMQLLGQDIYNGSGAWFSQTMATGFQGSLVSKNIQWLRYRMQEYELKGIDELDIWLQDVKQYMSEVYLRSNFYKVQPKFTLDGLTTGSPVMFAEEDILNRKTMWTPQYYDNIRIFYDKFNEANGVIVRDREWTAKQIFDTFIVKDDADGTKRKAKLPLAVNTALESGKLNDEFTVYRAVFRSNDQIWDGWAKKPVGDWSWYSVYFIENPGEEREKKDEPLNENIGYFSQPFVVWDFDKKPWEVASRTPAWYAIWDCMSLQEVFKSLTENMQHKNRPPVIALDTMKGRLALSPEAEIFVSKTEYDNPPRSMDMVGDIQLNKEMSDIYIDALKRWFYVDRFAMFSDLAMAKNQPVTASQVWQMAGEKSTLLSPAIETHSEYLEVADERMISIEAAAGRGPFNPQTMANITDIVSSSTSSPVSSIGITPVFIGPLAQAQKKSQELEPIMSGIAAVRDSGLIEIDENLRFAFRGYKTLTDILEATDFPQADIVGEEEYNARVQANNGAIAQQQQLENSIELAKASKDVSGPVDQSSILSTVAENA